MLRMNRREMNYTNFRHWLQELKVKIPDYLV